MNADLAAQITAFGAVAQDHIPVEIGKKAAVNIVVNIALAVSVQTDSLQQPGEGHNADDGEKQYCNRFHDGLPSIVSESAKIFRIKETDNSYYMHLLFFVNK